ncbi:unnamed protein product [Blepharisma stoltei]|uniref:Uncharacterized protein n=1 Tax=Blepharisma stoltei TaxID=1481888 RepID=A0AAU9IG61_9CILI|nr:unnamed protein product [Blepharisma stoltei]
MIKLSFIVFFLSQCPVWAGKWDALATALINAEYKEVSGKEARLFESIKLIQIEEFPASPGIKYTLVLLLNSTAENKLSLHKISLWTSGSANEIRIDSHKSPMIEIDSNSSQPIIKAAMSLYFNETIPALGNFSIYRQSINDSHAKINLTYALVSYNEKEYWVYVLKNSTKIYNYIWESETLGNNETEQYKISLMRSFIITTIVSVILTLIAITAIWRIKGDYPLQPTSTVKDSRSVNIPPNKT